MLRLVAGQLHFVDDDDVVITGDADLWSLEFGRFDFPKDKNLYLYNALCCGTFQHGNAVYRMYPLSNMAMTGKIWRSVFGKLIIGLPKESIYHFENIQPLLCEMETFANDKDIFNVAHGGKGWQLDQHYASVRIENYLYNYGRINFTINSGGRKDCKRLHLMKDLDLFKCLGDAHMSRDFPWRGKTWKEIKKLTVRIFDESTLSLFENYRLKFENLVRKL